MVVSLYFGGKSHVSNGCKMYLLRSPAIEWLLNSERPRNRTFLLSFKRNPQLPTPVGCFVLGGARERVLAAECVLRELVGERARPSPRSQRPQPTSKRPNRSLGGDAILGCCNDPPAKSESLLGGFRGKLNLISTQPKLESKDPTQ